MRSRTGFGGVWQNVQHSKKQDVMESDGPRVPNQHLIHVVSPGVTKTLIGVSLIQHYQDLVTYKVGGQLENRKP